MDMLKPSAIAPTVNTSVSQLVKAFLVHLFIRQWWVSAAILVTLATAASFVVSDRLQDVRKPLVGFETASNAVYESGNKEA